MLRRITQLFFVCAPLALGACTSNEGTYPSLAKRPAERITATWPPPPPAPPPVPPPLDAATARRLDALLGQVRSADHHFSAGVALARSRVAAARGSAMGTEVWSVATVAVSALEASRAQAMVAMAELDSIYADARTRGLDVEAVEITRRQAITIISAEDKVLDSLKGLLER